MLCSVDMLRSVTRPRALTRAVFRPPRSGRGSPERGRERERKKKREREKEKESRTKPADVNYFYEIGWCRFYLFWGKQPNANTTGEATGSRENTTACLPPGLMI